MLSGIFRFQYQQLAWLFNSLFGLTANETSNCHIVTTTPVTSGFPSPRAKDAGKVNLLHIRKLWPSHVYDLNPSRPSQMPDMSLTAFKKKTSRICVLRLRWFNEQRYNSVSDPDSNVHVAHMGPTWVLAAPGGPHKPYYQGTLPQCLIINTPTPLHAYNWAIHHLCLPLVITGSGAAITSQPDFLNSSSCGLL